MFDYFSECKKVISPYLSSWMMAKKDSVGKLFPEFESTFQRILHFTLMGKMIRGGLVILMNNLYSSKKEHVDASVLAVAASMEFIQSFLLIHDDIMDRDTLRRGESSVYIKYSEDIASQNRTLSSTEAVRIGEALGICAGDITNFFAFELLADVSIPDKTKVKLLSLASKELTRVGFAQMQDVRWSAINKIPLSDEIKLMYINKTGRYTFSLPMLCGAILSGAPEEDILNISELGDILGIIFQIKDDEIGLLGDPAITGKPVASDLREGKKTIFVSELIPLLTPEEKETFLSVFGNPKSVPQDAEPIISMIREKGVLTNLQHTNDLLVNKANCLINSLHGRADMERDILKQLLNYSLNRSN